MNCALCKAKMINSTTNLPFQMGDEYLVVIKAVPALVCKQCGDSFVEIQTMRHVEKIVKQTKMDGVTLGIVKYSEAA